jgi:hypothetical protein
VRRTCFSFNYNIRYAGPSSCRRIFFFEREYTCLWDVLPALVVQPDPAEGGVPTVHAGGGPNHHHIITIERRRDYNTKSPYGWAREGWASL